jgi:hypothetical protein
MKRQQLPSEITSLLPRCENNFAVLIGILGNEYLEIMIDWCGKNISEEDIQNSQTTQNNTDINQQELDLHNLHNLHNLPKIVQLIRQNQPQSAPCYIPGRSFNQIKINSQVTRNPGATNITHNSVTNNIPESSGLKVRSLNQLQKLYDQYH